jgi:hypothetical protein
MLTPLKCTQSTCPDGKKLIRKWDGQSQKNLTLVKPNLGVGTVLFAISRCLFEKNKVQG